MASLHIYGSVPSCQVLLLVSSSLCNAGCPRLTIISSYDKGELITVDTSSDSVIFLCSVRTSFCWCSSTAILLASL